MSDPDIEAAERIAVVEEFLSVVRHDLRNCFGTIRNASYYLSRKVKPTPVWEADERVPRFFAMIVDELQRADAILTDGIRATSTEEQPRAVAASVRADVESLGASYVEADGPHVVAADERGLRVAVRCLVRNALERPAATPPVVSVARDEECVRIDVIDDGPALDEEALVRARAPFETTKPGHLGIGLNVVDRFASRYGGSLALSARDGRTVASIALPAVEATP